MAAYTCDLDNGQQIYVDYQEPLTVITLTSGEPGQQQSQRNSFETGDWAEPPTLFGTSSGVVLRIETEQGQHFIQVQTNGMSRLNAAPLLNGAEVLPLWEVGTEAVPRHSLPDMQPMKPMKPMKPMSPMQMKPMAMHMDGMSMQMGEQLQTKKETESRQSTKNFCNQCGSKVQDSDRFCSQCGNRLV